MQRETFDVFCQNCNILVEAKVIAGAFGKYRSLNPSEQAHSEYHGDHYYVALCRRCDGPFLVRETLYGVPGEFETVTEETVLYPASLESRLEGVPDSIGRSLVQAYRSFSTSSYDACAVMCRRSLEALCRAQGAQGKGLASRLAVLKANGRIDTRLLDWAHGVRLVGNQGAHDADTAVSAEDARDILEFTEAVLMFVFTLDAKFQSFQARRKGGLDHPIPEKG